MSWLRTALTVSTPDPGAYYTVIDPVQFYEWRFTQMAPKGALFTKHLPPSDIFTKGKVIASVVIQEDALKPVERGMRLESATAVDLSVTAGAIPTPQELLDKRKLKKDLFAQGIKRFKEEVLTRLFLVSKSDDPHLLRIAEYDDAKVSIQNFGEITELIKTFAEVRAIIKNKSLKRTGKAHELEEFRRYENAMDFVNNSHLYVDSSKMDRLLMSAKVKPSGTKKLSWEELYLQHSVGAQHLDREIQYFDKMSWVKASNK